ncbi:MAG: sugar ABC transporter substrate-binding protein [Oscillospiraceae bacterium]|nr:sugar ABC transporter substrate-binding protein [Oscillospiraceae bacterium]
MEKERLMKKKFLAGVLALMMTLSLAACGGGQTAPANDGAADNADANADAQSEANVETETTGDENYHISVVLKTNSSEHWAYVQAGAEAYQKDHPNVQVDVKGPPSETSYDEQQNMIETDRNNSSYDAYVIAPLQNDMVANMIAGMDKPVIALDTNIVAPEIVSFVGTGNEAAAKMGAEAAVAMAKERGWETIECIEIAGVQGDATNTARMDGYRAGVNESGGTFLDNEVQYANAVADQAVTCMEAIIQNHPEGVAIICANNDDMAVAAARTCEGNEAYANTVFLGFDGAQNACVAILDGQLTMSICQHPYQMGYLAVESAVKAIQGEELPDFQDTGTNVIDPDTAQDRLDELKGYGVW